MKAFLFPLAVLASSAAAQTTSACAANYIVEACLSTENSKLAACGTQNYDCQCTQWKNIMTCYNNCPNDPRLHNAAGQRDIFCGYATQFPSTTLQTATSAAPATAAQTTQASTNANAAAGTGTSASESASATSTGSTKSNSAAYLALNAGGVLAAVAGVVAVVL